MLKRKFEETEGLPQSGDGANPESDDSNCSAGSTDALAPEALVQPPAKRHKKRVNFQGVTVYYFPRRQGFTCVPSEGGSTLGMSEKHSFHRDFSLSDYTKEQKRIHRAILAEQRRQGKLFPSPLLGNASMNMSESTDDISSGSESDSEYDDYYFLQPLPIRQRRVLLRTAGVKKIDNEEKDACRDIRVSRNVCGCDCKIFCDPETCACSVAGIQCQVDRLSFPCGCTKEGCANPSGRIEFNPIRVKTHFIHTLMRLELERKDREIQVNANSSSACVLGNSSSSLPSSSVHSSQALLSCEDSHKIVDVVGEDNEVGMGGEEEERKVVCGPNTNVASDNADEGKSSASCLLSEISCSSSSSSKVSNGDSCSGTKALKSNLKSKKEESIDLNLFNSNERGSCRDCQNTDMCNVMMHDVKFSMVSQQQRQHQQQQQQQHQHAMAQSLFNGQQILHSHSLSQTSPGLSLFQPLPQQTASAHHHMMMFNDADDETSYHPDSSGPLYFDHDDSSYSEINETVPDSSFPVITQTNSGNFRNGPTVMFTTSMNTDTHSPGTRAVSSPVRVMRPQVSLLNRSTLSQFGMRPLEMGVPHEFGAGPSAPELGMASMCNGVSSSLSPSSQQLQHGLHNQSLLSGVSKPITDVSQAASEQCNPQRLVSSLVSAAEGMPGTRHNLNQPSNISAQGILNDPLPPNRALSIPSPGVMPGLSTGLTDPSNSHVCGTFHTNLVSSLGKSTCDQMKQNSHSVPEPNYDSVLAVPAYHAGPSQAAREYESSHAAANVTSASCTSINVNCNVSSSSDSISSDTVLQHQPLLSCWSTSLTSPTIPECFAGMGSNSLVPSSLISQSSSEPAKSDCAKQAPNSEAGGPSQASPSPSSTTYATMTTTTRDQLAAYCPGISSHMDSRSETQEAQCSPVKEPESTFPDFSLNREGVKPTSSLLADSQSILFSSSFEPTAESSSSSLVMSSVAPITSFSPFAVSSTTERKDLVHPTSGGDVSVSSSVTSSSPVIQNGHHHVQETVMETRTEGSDKSAPVTSGLASEKDKPGLQCNVVQSDLQSKPCVSVNINHGTGSLAGQDDVESSKQDCPKDTHLDNDKNINKLDADLTNGEASPTVPSASVSSSSSSPSSSSSNAALSSSLSSLPSTSSSSSSSSTASSTSSSDDEQQKSIAQEFDDIVKNPIAEMVSA